jgi:hypothetical protein
MKRAFHNRDVILHYDGEYWWAHDTLKEVDTVIYKHSVLDVVLEAIDEYYIKNPQRPRKTMDVPLTEGH